MEVLQLKDNIIPRGLMPLEEIFYQDDVARKNRAWFLQTKELKM